MNSRSDRTHKIAHLADLHFDTAHLADAICSFRYAVRVAIERGCDALVLAGDIWDRGVALDDASPVMPVVREIRNAAEFMPVVIDYGNHDKPGSLDVFAELTERHPIVVASTPRTYAVSGMHFSILPYPHKSTLLAQATTSQDASDLTAADALRSIVAGFAAEYSAMAYADVPHILVYHGTVTGSTTESGQTMLGGDVLISAGDLETSGADYVALGHIHMKQQLGTRCYYPGSLYHCNYGEIERKTMNIVTVWRGGHEVEEIPLPSRPKVVIDVTVEEHDTFTVETAVDIPADADVKIRYRVTEEQARTVREDAIACIAEGAHEIVLERIVVPRERIRCESIADVKSLGDKVQAWGAAVEAVIPAGVLAKAQLIEAEGGAR